MRRLLSALPLALLPLAGCAMPTPGFHCGFDLPSTVQSPALVSQQPGSIGVAGLATGGAVFAAPPPRSLAALAQESPCGELPMPRASAPNLAATAPRCTMDDLCALMQEINRKLSAQGFRPMPSTAP